MAYSGDVLPLSVTLARMFYGFGHLNGLAGKAQVPRIIFWHVFRSPWQGMFVGGVSTGGRAG